MKRYSLWIKFLCFFLAVITLMCVAVSGLGIFAAESLCMYTHKDYREWLYSQYRDSAQVIADQVLLEYGSTLSDCPQWLLDQTGHYNAVARVQNWYDLTENNWCYSIMKDGRVLVSTHSENLEEDALHFIFERELHYPMLVEEAQNVEYFVDPVTDVPVCVTWEYQEGYQIDVWISRDHTS